MRRTAEKRLAVQGSITVFLSLISVLFLSLIFTVIESGRIQGARAQTANIVDMANYSLFGEYEKKLLEKYEIFAVDGARGSGNFSMDRINDRLKHYMNENAQPKRDGLLGLCFDPWQVQLKDSEISEYALLTDQGGEAFYQQAVSFMKATAVTGTVGKLLSYRKDAQNVGESQKKYEKEKYSSEREMKELEQQEEAKKRELSEQTEQEKLLLPAEEVLPENPLKMIGKLRRKSLLQLVCGSAKLSEKKISNPELASKNSWKKGKMKIKQPNKGLISDLLFREYLLDRFSHYLSREPGEKLDYQMEYILCGKTSDQANLKGTVQKLLLLREGMNYLYCSSNSEMNAQAGSLAALLIGWMGIPALTAVLKHGLLLGWAYGESLLDVKTLLDGGSIPLSKTAESWVVTLERLGQLPELLEEDRSGRQEGMDYEEYLRILLNLQPVSTQKKRALDLVELNVRSVPGLDGFRVNYCIVGIKNKTNWVMEPVFLRVPAAFLNTGAKKTEVTVKSGFAYDG